MEASCCSFKRKRFVATAVIAAMHSVDSPAKFTGLRWHFTRPVAAVKLCGFSVGTPCCLEVKLRGCEILSSISDILASTSSSDPHLCLLKGLNDTNPEVRRLSTGISHNFTDWKAQSFDSFGRHKPFGLIL